jgi:hypothetical protein
VYAVNATTGEKVWNYTADFCPASPAITEDLVIFGAYDGLLHYLNRSDGKQVHTVPVQFAEIYSSAGLFTYEYEQDYDLPMVFVATTGGKMLGIGPDGKEFWNATHEAGITSSPLVVTEVEEPYDPFIVYGDEGGRLHGVEIHNPYQVFHYTYVHSYVEWHVKLGSSIQSSPFLWHERVYVGVETADGGGRVVCLGGDIRDDEVVMTIGQPGSIFGIVGEGGTVEVHVTTYNFSPDRIDVTFDGTVRPASRNWSIEPYDPRADVWTVEFPATVPEGRRLVIARAYEDDVEVLVAVGEVMSLVEGWDSVDVTIDHPADGEVVTEPILVASGQASSNYTIWWVKYYFDEADFFSWRDCTGTENWTAAIETDRLDEGWHDLTIVANDYYRTGRLVVRIHIGELDDEEEEERIEPVEVILLIILIVVLVVLFRTKPPRVSEKASGH